MERCPVCNAVLEITTDGRFCPNCHWHKRPVPDLPTVDDALNIRLRRTDAPRAQAVEELVKAVREILPPERKNGAWWCPDCLAYVSAASVTHNERHEGCGAEVEWYQGEPPRVAALRAALARLDAGEKEGC